MQLTILQKNLHQGLNIISHIAEKNLSIPILNNILIKAKDNIITLAATNLEIGITKQIRGKIIKEGTTTVDAKILSDYITLLPNEKIDIQLVNKQDLKINCEKYNTVIKGQNSEDFPVIPQIDKKISLTLSVSDLKVALNQLLFAINPTDSRLELTGILFDINDKNINLVSTDSFRLAKKEINFHLYSGTIDSNGLKIIVPLKTMQELARIINFPNDELTEDSDQIQMHIADNQILFVYQGVEMVSRLIEGHYPDYIQVIPTNCKTEISIDRGELLRAIKMASIFSANSNAVDLTINTDQQQVTVEAVSGQIGSHQAKLSAKINGQDNSIRLNYRYLLDCLNVLSANQISFKIIDDISACKITLPGSEEYQYIVVPLRK